MSRVDGCQDSLVCDLWRYPATSCMPSGCGMPSGHTCLAYFYLGWGAPYVYRWHRWRQQQGHDHIHDPLLLPRADGDDDAASRAAKVIVPASGSGGVPSMTPSGSDGAGVGK